MSKQDSLDDAFYAGLRTAKPCGGPKPVWLTFTMEQYQEADELNSGYCRACGAMRDCCEPGARNYPCEDCGNRQVFGAQELLLTGLVE